jgi:3'-phosphoadenosine 5'-phosphosulfate sulfotransferase (PAPS reductase)/FAD synthetase
MLEALLGMLFGPENIIFFYSTVFDSFGTLIRRILCTFRRLLMRPFPDCPLIVAYGLGVDSTAMLVEFARRDIRPDAILFADTGGEKPETYRYLSVITPFLKSVGFPEVTVVRYQRTRSTYDTLEGQCY